jgi:Tfp pilus assembly protein FimT
MQQRIREGKGFSLHELTLVVGSLAVLSGISVPVMSGVLQRSYNTGAVDALGSAIRDARMRAIATGWQYRVVVFDSAGPVPNAFRIEGMDPTIGGAWPAATATNPPAFSGSNQAYEPYNSLDRDFRRAQIQIPSGGPTFTVTFDSRGQQATACVPLGCQVQVTSKAGTSTITVSQAGAVQIAR